MNLFEALLLGAVQGLFMFIPVSSTSHLVLTQHWLRANGSELPAPDSPEMILFDLLVHVGTLVSIVVVLQRPLRRFLGGLARDLRSGWLADVRAGTLIERRPRLRLAGLAAVSVATTGVIGLVVRATGTGVFASPGAVAALLVVTGGVLWWTDRAPAGWHAGSRLGVRAAIIIGAMQGLALLPGLSRSGLTIAAALAVGLARPAAALYSFFLAIPTIGAAMAVQAVDVWRDAPLQVGTGAYTVAFVTAALVGTASLAMVLRLLYQARFRIFVPYVLLVAVVVLVVAPSRELFG